MAEDIAIRARGLYRSFPGQHVLQGVDLDCPRGDTTVVIGRSGIGKSVLLKHIIGLMKPDKGEIWIDGIEITNLSSREMDTVRRRFGMLFQSAALFDSMTVMENVSFPLQEHTQLTRGEIEEKVREKLRLVGLIGAEHKMPSELSGGMRKRVGLARALVLEPELMLYDEPTTGLDPIMSDVINELLLEASRHHPVTSVIVTHDMRTARKVADRVVMLYPFGRLKKGESQMIYDGPPQEIDATADHRVAQFVRGEAGERLMEMRERGDIIKSTGP